MLEDPPAIPKVAPPYWTPLSLSNDIINWASTESLCMHAAFNELSDGKSYEDQTHKVTGKASIDPDSLSATIKVTSPGLRGTIKFGSLATPDGTVVVLTSANRTGSGKEEVSGEIWSYSFNEKVELQVPSGTPLKGTGSITLKLTATNHQTPKLKYEYEKDVEFIYTIGSTSSFPGVNCGTITGFIKIDLKKYSGYQPEGYQFMSSETAMKIQDLIEAEASNPTVGVESLEFLPVSPSDWLSSLTQTFIYSKGVIQSIRSFSEISRTTANAPGLVGRIQTLMPILGAAKPTSKEQFDFTAGKLSNYHQKLNFAILMNGDPILSNNMDVYWPDK